MTTWKAVGANVRDQLHGDVNATLEREGIPHVREDVFRWRMDQAIRNAAKAGKFIRPEKPCY
jgi:hypothetical protein